MKAASSSLAAFADGATSSSPARLSFQRKGDAYLLSNGALELRGELCGERLVQSIRTGGRDCGCLDALLKLNVDGTIQWPAIRALCKINFIDRGGVGILELTGDWWEFKPPWTVTGVALRVRVRLTIRPGEPRFLAEFVQLENAGTKDLLAQRFCFNVLPAKGIAPVCGPKQPNGEKSSSWDLGNGLSFGLHSEDTAVQPFAFWIDEKSHCPHGDCGFDFPKDMTLRPGQSFAPPIPPGAIVFIRKG